MLKFKNLNDESLKIYRKLFKRHLKNLGIYTQVIGYIRMKETNFDALFYKWSNYHVLENIVDCAWDIIKKSYHDSVTSSVFVLSLLNDEELYNVFKCSSKDTQAMRITFDRMVGSLSDIEYDYLLRLSNTINDEAVRWNNAREIDIEVLKTIVNNYKTLSAKTLIEKINIFEKNRKNEK